MNQKNRVLDYSQTHNGITQAEAYDAFGCLRLSERIRELADLGYKIEKVWEEDLNRYGEKVRYVRYFVTKKGA